MGSLDFAAAIAADPPDVVEQQLGYVRDRLAEIIAAVGHVYAAHPTEFITAVAACVVAAYTIVFARSTRQLWRTAEAQSRDMKASISAAEGAARAAVASNQIAVTNARQQLRAYVTAKEVEVVTHRHPAQAGANGPAEGPIHTYGLAAVLRNGGQTPATSVTTNVSCQKLSRELPNDFDFPDSASTGNGLIGPDSEARSPTIRVAAAEFEQIDSDHEWYLWGWIEYDDIFGGKPRHRTEFCFQTVRSRLPHTNEFWVSFTPYSRFNAADGACLRPTGRSAQ